MADAFGGLSRAQLALTAAGRSSAATQRAPLQQRPISSMSMDEIVAQLERAEATLAGPIRENLPDKGALLEQRVAELRAALEDRRNGMDADQPRGLRAHEQGEQRIDRMIEMPIAEASRIVAAQTQEVSVRAITLAGRLLTPFGSHACRESGWKRPCGGSHSHTRLIEPVRCVRATMTTAARTTMMMMRATAPIPTARTWMSMALGMHRSMTTSMTYMTATAAMKPAFLTLKRAAAAGDLAHIVQKMYISTTITALCRSCRARFRAERCLLEIGSQCHRYAR